MGKACDELKNTIERLVLGMMISYPFFAFILRSIPIYCVKTGKLILVDDKALYIDPDLFLGIPKQDMYYVLLHGLIHIISFHRHRIALLSRRRGVDPLTLNCIADAITNSELTTMIAPKTLETIEARTIMRELKASSLALEKVEKNTKIDYCKKFVSGTHKITIPDIILEEKPSGELILKGKDELLRAEAWSEIEAILKDIIVSSYISAKQAGEMPGWLERIVEKIIEPKINWRMLLRWGLQRGLGRRIKRTYSRPNRKFFVSGYSLYPGKLFYGSTKALILLDTSGSIDDQEINMLLSETYGVLKYGGCKKITIIPWDTRPYDPIHIKSVLDLKKIRVRGGGGTRLGPALDEALKLVDRNTILIIMSDFYIAEDSDPISKKRLIEKLEALGKRALIPIMVTTGKEIRVKGWTTIKLEK